jgi:endonuclease/exonuclease/phosphatase family metal-dependent hydrolase
MMIEQFRNVTTAAGIKIITINTWKCGGDYPVRMQILAGQLKKLNPGIVACQECFQSDEADADTLKFLAGELGMNYSFLPGRYKKRQFEEKWVDSFAGLGILSAYSIDNTREFILPPAPGDDDRKAQQVEIVLPSGENITVTNTHLTHLSHAGGVRRTQAEALAGFVTDNKAQRYHIICGDFNASRGSVEIETFMGLSGALDCYCAGNGIEPRYSLADAFKTGKLICVDHIFALPIVGKSEYPEFRGSGTVLNTPDESAGLFPSDHFGISTTLVIH